MPLLELAGRALAADSKTIVSHAFDVPPGVAAIELAFEHEPRRCTDPDVIRPLVRAAIEAHLATHGPARRAEVEARLAAYEPRMVDDGLDNHLDVTLIDPSGAWRGRSAGAIEPGRWTAVVEIHGVFGAPVDYRLRVTTSAAAPPKTTTFERGRPHRERWGEAGRSWFLGELRPHAGDAVDRARGLDFLCLTDDGSCAIAGLPITILRGSEPRTFSGHHFLYGIDRPEPWHEDGVELPFPTLARRAHERGALVATAHPFALRVPPGTGFTTDDVDAIEVWRGAWDSAEWNNRAAYDAWNAAWAAGRRITAFAARDARSAEAPFPGDEPFTAVLAEDASEAALLAGLRAGRVIMTGGPLLTLDVDGATIGDTVPHRAGLVMTCRIAARERGAHLVVYRDNERFFTTPVVEDGTTLVSGDVGPGGYRAELHLDGRPRAITNHVVVAP